MTKNEIFQLMNENPGFFLATVDGNIPHVRGMLLYRADEDGILFHTAASKDVYRQIKQNPHAELCFLDPKTNVQLRVNGRLDIEDSKTLKDEIINHPSRNFLSAWKESFPADAYYDDFIIFCLRDGKATLWSMETNFSEKEYINL